MIIDMLQLEKF